MTERIAPDGPALRRELALRILLQNGLLVISLILFAAFSITILSIPESAWLAVYAHGAVGLGAALQWCHHGIRTKQIKEYLLEIDDGSEIGWERWLPAHRPQTLLGSRWLISTKGVFLGLQIAMILLGWVTHAKSLVGLSIGVIFLLTTAAFLLTNPKE